VGHIDHDAHPVAAANDLGAERRQAAVDGLFCLDVAQLVGPVVRELRMAQRPALVGIVEPLDLALQEVAPSDDTMTEGRDERAARNSAALLMIGSACSRASA
jgi:hypothetical protein